MRSLMRLAAPLSLAIGLFSLACGGPASPADTGGVGGTGQGSGGAGGGGGGAPKGSVLSVACGDFHSCALLADRSVRCWGRNKSGEVGDPSNTEHLRPVAVPGLSGVEELALGSNFSCARLSDGTVKCWGSGRILGDNKFQERLPPTTVPGISDAKQLRAGGYLACAVTGSGDVKCWGSDRGTGAPRPVAEVAVAGAHGCARMVDGAARCWGEGIWGSPGRESFARPAVSGATRIGTGDGFACAIVEGGSVRCWGRNDQGELGVQADGDNHVEPTTVPLVKGAVEITAAEAHACVVDAAHRAICWGANDEGELGRGTRSQSEPPGPIPGLDVRTLSIGADHACAVAMDGGVYCWGNNKNGQVGDGTNERRTTPVRLDL